MYKNLSGNQMDKKTEGAQQWWLSLRLGGSQFESKPRQINSSKTLSPK
jgi:hypothetical protein